ncbi:MAG: HAMP domain-containing protein [Anaerolineae bacterium]|nr:MAG: HAMP domain-containing protein [Anaerolineae bacterium]
MDLILTLLQEQFYFDLPTGFTGWLVWFALAGLALLLVARFRAYAPTWDGRLTFLLLVLGVAAPLAALALGLRLPDTGMLPPPGRPIPPVGPAVMLFAALPWVLAAGLLGPLPAAGLAALSGLVLAGFDGHSAFTPLILAIIAVLLSAALRQRYRTLAYRFWRRPMLAAPALSLVFALLALLTLPLTVSGTLASRLDYTFARIGWVTLAVFFQLLVAGMLSEIAAFGLPSRWGGTAPLQPSPGERSLQTRLFNLIAPLALLFLLLLMFGMWRIAGNAAGSTLEERLRTTADSAAQGVPFFLETGQNLIAQLSEDPRLYLTQGAELDAVLTQDLRSVPYFDQLAVLDAGGRVLGGFPLREANAILLSPDEIQALELAFAGVQFQMYSLPPGGGDIAGRMSFLHAVRDGQGTIQVVLLGRTSLSTNPFTEPILDNLAAMKDIGGYGILLDEQGLIMYHPEPQLVGTAYTGALGLEPVFAEQPGTDGTRQLVYSRPVPGRGWGVVTSVPARVAQQTAMTIAAPVLGGVLAVLLLAFVGLWFALRRLGGSLQKLAAVSTTIAAGDLDRPLVLQGTDELGQLGQSFEQMRLSLKARLDELNRLLSVSQGIASALDMERAVGPVLEAALTTGAAAARLVLTPAALPEFTEDKPSHYGLGPAAARYEALDNTLLAFTQRQPRVVLSDPARTRLNLPPGTPLPAALLAVALRNEDTHYGVLWAAYDEAHTFAEDEISFLSTVAAQAALAAANARLYLGAQLGRQRLEAILAATPDPVLVTDNRDRLLLANPAAATLLGGTTSPGTPLKEALPSHPELRALLKATAAESESAEVRFPEDRIYYASASTVVIEGRLMGRVCVLRDITRYKELDALKSEFVANVSHDLRSPLTLMRGYATMLQMVGSLNDQQTGYLKKIDNGIQSMVRLVNNLLDLGRIEAGVDLRLEMVPAADLARQVVDSLRPNALQKQIRLSLSVPEQTMPVVESDSALLYQAMQNLVENAIKYTEPKGTVDVSLTVDAHGIQFAVKDTGLGIAPVDQPRLFERFYRAAAREARKQSGSGLGLAIVKSIVDRHGGSVKVESRLGEGSLFAFSIPLRQDSK